eukprot:403359231
MQIPQLTTLQTKGLSDKSRQKSQQSKPLASIYSKEQHKTHEEKKQIREEIYNKQVFLKQLVNLQIKGKSLDKKKEYFNLKNEATTNSQSRSPSVRFLHEELKKEQSYASERYKITQEKIKQHNNDYNKLSTIKKSIKLRNVLFQLTLQNIAQVVLLRNFIPTSTQKIFRLKQQFLIVLQTLGIS